MVNLIEEAKSMIGEDEKILKEIIVQRLMKTTSTIIFLTNKKVIYWKVGFMKKGFETIDLSEINGITYLPQPFHSAGLIKIITKNGKNVLISPSYVSQIEANDFIKEVKKKIKQKNF